MATQVQNRRGTTAQHSAFTGANGELTVDTDKDVVVVHDGSTAGGHPMLKQDGSNSAFALGSAASPSLKWDANTGIYSPGADQLAISTGGSERLRVTSDGKLALGTASSTARLTISGNAICVPITLTDAASIAVNMALSNSFAVTLGGNRTLGAPTNVVAGQSGVIRVAQDATGSRTLAYNSIFKFPGGTAPTLSTAANAVDLLAYYVESTSRIAVRFIGDVK